MEEDLESMVAHTVHGLPGQKGTKLSPSSCLSGRVICNLNDHQHFVHRLCGGQKYSANGLFMRGCIIKCKLTCP